MCAGSNPGAAKTPFFWSFFAFFLQHKVRLQEDDDQVKLTWSAALWHIAPLYSTMGWKWFWRTFYLQVMHFLILIVWNLDIFQFVSSLGGWRLKSWKMKVLQMRQTIAHFDQWRPLILEMQFIIKFTEWPPRLLRFRGHFRGCRGQILDFI